MFQITKYRKAAGLTQVELADLIGVSPITLCRYETGTREPRAGDLMKMAECLNCTMDDLAGNPSPPSAVESGAKEQPVS